MLYFLIQECHGGFIWSDCTMKCRYPSFGIECQNKCNCNKTLCNPSTGCKGLLTLSTNLQKALYIFYMHHINYSIF